MATNDLLSLAEAKTALNITNTAHDTEVQLFLTGMSTRIDGLCGPVVIQTVTTERHDGGKSFIVPRLVPVSTVTSVTEYDDAVSQALTAETITSQLTDMFLLDTSLKFYPRIWRRESGSDSRFPTGRLNVAVTYVAGRVATTATVGTNFKLAAAAILRRVWKRETSSWAQRPSYTDESSTGQPEGFYRAIDPMVREFLNDELLPMAVG